MLTEGLGHELIGSIAGTVANLGFPIAISIYLLVRLENRMESLSERIKELGQAINKMI